MYWQWPINQIELGQFLYLFSFVLSMSSDKSCIFLHVGVRLYTYLFHIRGKGLTIREEGAISVHWPLVICPVLASLAVGAYVCEHLDLISSEGFCVFIVGRWSVHHWQAVGLEIINLVSFSFYFSSIVQGILTHVRKCWCYWTFNTVCSSLLTFPGKWYLE